MTSVSQVLDSPLLMLHFALSGLSTLGHPTAISHAYLQPFLPGQLLEYCEVVFNFSTTEDVRIHHQNMVMLKRSLER